MPGVFPPQGEGFALSAGELHEILVNRFLQPVKIPLNSSSTLKYTSHSSQLDVIHELAESALHHTV